MIMEPEEIMIMEGRRANDGVPGWVQNWRQKTNDSLKTVKDREQILLDIVFLVLFRPSINGMKSTYTGEGNNWLVAYNQNVLISPRAHI